MYRIFVNGVCLYKSDFFNEFLVQYKQAVSKYGWDAVNPECTNPDGITINLKLHMED